MQSDFVTVNGVRLHYLRAGSGPILVLLHGFPETSHSWRKVIPLLKAHFTLIVLDLRGYGKSDKPRSVREYSTEKLAGDLLGLADHLGQPMLNVVAHDWGGGVAWAFALLHPKRLNRLMILNCPHPALFRKQLKSNFRQMMRSWYMLAFQLPKLPETMMKLLLRPMLRNTFQGWALRKDAFSQADLDHYYEEFSKPGALTAAINYYRAYSFAPKELETRLNQTIDRPVKVLWAQNDQALGPELTDGMEEYVTGEYELQKIENCSHWVQAEVPDVVAEAAKDWFLREVPEE